MIVTTFPAKSTLARFDFNSFSEFETYYATENGARPEEKTVSNRQLTIGGVRREYWPKTIDNSSIDIK